MWLSTCITRGVCGVDIAKFFVLDEIIGVFGAFYIYSRVILVRTEC